MIQHQDHTNVNNVDLIQSAIANPDESLYHFHRLLEKKFKVLLDFISSPEVRAGDIVVVEGSVYYIYFVLGKFSVFTPRLLTSYLWYIFS